MAYGNYAPFYRPGYFNPMTQYQPMQDNNQYITMNAQPQDGFLWVLNRNEADAYPVALNNSVILWDKNAPTIYVKSVNAQGIPSMRILDFTERTQTALAGNIPTAQFATLDAFNALRDELDGVKRVLEQIQTKKTIKNTKTTEVDENGESTVQAVWHSDR